MVIFDSGVNGLVLSAAATYAPGGVRVNAVAPGQPPASSSAFCLFHAPHASSAGLTDTRLAARIMSSEPAKQMSLAMHALGRFGSAADCASVVDLLLDSSRCLSTKLAMNTLNQPRVVPRFAFV
jgi:NAD(P)-dependent dehydrogenase (short-subunit alcohol dehydrogenase family)